MKAKGERAVKVLSVVGARPQFIKEAIVGEELRKRKVVEILVHTGQHYDAFMSDVFFSQLNLKRPDYNLHVGPGTHAYQTGTTMIRLEEVALKENPDIIVVYGDTNATLGGALVGAKLKIPVAHVEAGLRQLPKTMPEEINRVVTDHVSSFLFCPTSTAVENLKREGITKGVYFTGDVMYDLFKKIQQIVKHDEVLARYHLKRENYVLATVHRDFNTDDRQRLERILSALGKISQELCVVFPMHPRTKKAIDRYNLRKALQKTLVLEPVPYQDLISLVIGAKKVVTDSGGLQKEAYFAGVHAVVLMPDTAWIELIDSGWNILADADEDKIVKYTLHHQDEQSDDLRSIYGNGNAGARIAEILLATHEQT